MLKVWILTKNCDLRTGNCLNNFDVLQKQLRNPWRWSRRTPKRVEIKKWLACKNCISIWLIKCDIVLTFVFPIDIRSDVTLFVYKVCSVHKHGNIILFYTRKFPEGRIFCRKCMSRFLNGPGTYGASILNARQDSKRSPTLCVSYPGFC